MNPLYHFIFVAVTLLAISLFVLLRPLLRKPRQDEAAAETMADSNVAALRIELTEARRDHALGLMSDDALREAEHELQARVLREAELSAVQVAPKRYKRTAIAIGLLVPLLAIGAYSQIGAPVGLFEDVVRPQMSEAEKQMNELFSLAEKRLAESPNDANGWYLLARAKASVGRFDEAMQAYQHATTLVPDQADWWADYADAAAGKAQGQFSSEVLALINKALALDPHQAKALLLRGTYEIQQNQLAAAEKTFNQVKAIPNLEAGYAQIADNALNDVRQRQGGAGGTTEAIPPVLAELQLSLSDDARKAVSAQSAIFVIVRTAGVDRGPPLAAKKIATADLDQAVSLRATDAMIGGAGLSAGTEVSIQARLSRNGQPTPQAGDWQSAPITLKLPASQVLPLRITQSVE